MYISDPLMKKEIILYHGSRGGIEGNIVPISRIRCDFGKGFYMGTNPMQAKGIVVDDSVPVFYELKLNLSAIPNDKGQNQDAALLSLPATIYVRHYQASIGVP